VAREASRYVATLIGPASVSTEPEAGDGRVPARVLALSTLAVAVIDGVFAIALYVVILKGTSVPRLFQGIASTVLRAASFSGGARTVAIGVAMHFTVALAWTLVFYVAMRRSRLLRRTLESPHGPLRVALWYGPLVYATMTLVVIPAIVHRMPALDGVWLVVLLGHIPFVALPITLIVGRGARRR
jgi:hypothetical protein